MGLVKFGLVVVPTMFTPDLVAASDTKGKRRTKKAAKELSMFFRRIILC